MDHSELDTIILISIILLMVFVQIIISTFLRPERPYFYLIATANSTFHLLAVLFFKPNFSQRKNKIYGTSLGYKQ